MFQAGTLVGYGKYVVRREDQFIEHESTERAHIIAVFTYLICDIFVRSDISHAATFSVLGI